MRRRPPFPPNRRPPIGHRLRLVLREAQQLKDRGDYKAAAIIFERLAKGAENHGIERAPFLYLQAAHCYILDGQAEQGVGLTNHGLRLLVKSKRWSTLFRSGTRATQILKENNLHDPAQKIQTWLDEQLVDHPESKETPSSQSHLNISGKSQPRLPNKCPFCGANLRSDQVLWIDDHSVECTYCGSVVSTNG
jgi:hypothetical protein